MKNLKNPADLPVDFDLAVEAIGDALIGVDAYADRYDAEDRYEADANLVAHKLYEAGIGLVNGAQALVPEVLVSLLADPVNGVGDYPQHAAKVAAQLAEYLGRWDIKGFAVRN